jgi:SnoaL-like protein
VGPALALALFLQAASPPPAPPTDEALRRTVADYVGLYKRDTLDRWRTLFLPTFTATHTLTDGTVRVRTLDEFFAAQRGYLDTGRAIKEELENVRFDRRGKLATAWADFVLTEEGEKSRGKLVLLLVADRGEWRIQALMFSYDGE